MLRRSKKFSTSRRGSFKPRRTTTVRRASSRGRKVIRYAVVGLGHIAQNAVLPAFQNAPNSELTALISDDPKKLKQLGRHYRVTDTLSYDDYEDYLHAGNVDAVYIALPNSLHKDFCLRAANARVNVLCEKPLAVTESDCEQIIRACAENDVKLMVAYRLHFERANLEAVKIVQSGKIGEPRIFQSLFSMPVKPGNIRLDRELGGGTLYDIGIYCINAARYLFRAEPTEAIAVSERNDDPRFAEVDEMTSAILRFPENRLAAFSTSFGATDTATLTVAGTKGLLRMESAYEYSEAIKMEVTVGGKTQRREFKRRDQFAPELIYFSDCILKNREPEPSGVEGLIDVHIIQSLYHSAAKGGRPVSIRELQRHRRPSLRQEIHRPALRQPRKIRVQSPSE